jgi:hypothetical protein
MYRSLFLILAGAVLAAAQQPGRPPGIVPPKPDEVEPADPPGIPAVAPLPRNLPNPNTPTTLNAANLTGQDIADLYFQYTGSGSW